MKNEVYETLKKYPRLCAQVISRSLGYATPREAAIIVLNAKRKEDDWCEWVSHSYNSSAVDCVRDSIKTRHRYKKGFMCSYDLALKLVKDEILNPEANSNMLASWF